MNSSYRLVAATLLLALSVPVSTLASDPAQDFEAAAADLVIARPLWLVATAIGTGLFVVSLPVAAMSRSVNKTARTLVAKPAAATFTRPLGDFSSLD